MSDNKKNVYADDLSNLDIGLDPWGKNTKEEILQYIYEDSIDTYEFVVNHEWESLTPEQQNFLKSEKIFNSNKLISIWTTNELRKSAVKRFHKFNIKDKTKFNESQEKYDKMVEKYKEKVKQIARNV